MELCALPLRELISVECDSNFFLHRRDIVINNSPLILIRDEMGTTGLYARKHSNNDFLKRSKLALFVVYEIFNWHFVVPVFLHSNAPEFYSDWKRTARSRAAIPTSP